MVSITLSVPEDTKKLMGKFPEMNWSGFIRGSIQEKVKQLSWKEEMLKKLKEEEPLTRWAVALGRKAKKERFKEVLSKLSPKERKELLG